MFTSNFRHYLTEAKEQLDISIQAAGKYLTNDKKRTEFLSKPVTIEHKTDGIKITVIKKSNNGNINDYIIAYKGDILYSTEFDYLPKTKIKSESIGASQFKLVLEHFSKLNKNSIPVGTELFIEYLMSKPTLSSNYSTKHKMVLIGHSQSSYEENYGKLKTKPSGFYTDKRNEYAKELKIDVPQLLFKGVLGSQSTFENGILNKILLAEFNQRKLTFTWDVPEILIDDLRQMFLDIESKYGGKEEGVVMIFDDRILKWQQEYQVDQEARNAIKMKYKENNPEDEEKYWVMVRGAAEGIARTISTKNRKIEDLMEEISLIMKRIPINFTHSKKTETHIKDDIQGNVKTLVLKSMKGNNNALILGKFRILTKEGHYKLINRARKLYDKVVVCLVTSKETKDTLELREKMLKAAFPDIIIIHHSTGNLFSIMQKSPVNINVVYAGTDRVKSYQEMLKGNVGMSVREMPRSDSDISASKVIANINDEDFFYENTPKEIHSMYNEIKNTYKD